MHSVAGDSLDLIDSAYELADLEAKINKSINSTTSISAQQKLNKLKQDEIEILK
jgi:hypothetical protein